MESENAPLLVYDGDCSFCSSSARWITARWNGPQRAVAWQHLTAADLERLGLTADDVRDAAWWVDPARGKSRGHLAIARDDGLAALLHSEDCSSVIAFHGADVGSSSAAYNGRSNLRSGTNHRIATPA